MAKKKAASKVDGPKSAADALALARRFPDRGRDEENTFTLRDKSGHRIDPHTREKVPRGYDIATAEYPRDQIVPFTPKINRRK